MVCLQVHELEGELESEVRRNAEAQRGARRLERCIKELTYQVLWEATPCSLGCSALETVLLQAQNGPQVSYSSLSIFAVPQQEIPIHSSRAPVLLWV